MGLINTTFPYPLLKHSFFPSSFEDCTFRSASDLDVSSGLDASDSALRLNVRNNLYKVDGDEDDNNACNLEPRVKGIIIRFVWELGSSVL